MDLGCCVVVLSPSQARERMLCAERMQDVFSPVTDSIVFLLD
jgi:hypothetical protein